MRGIKINETLWGALGEIVLGIRYNCFLIYGARVECKLEFIAVIWSMNNLKLKYCVVHAGYFVYYEENQRSHFQEAVQSNIHDCKRNIERCFYKTLGKDWYSSEVIKMILICPYTQTSKVQHQGNKLIIL